MVGVLICMAFAAVVAALFVAARYLFRNPAKRGSGSVGSGLLTASLDEVFHPRAADAQADLDREHRLIVPAPTPDPFLPEER